MESEIIVNIRNPGEVFACMGFLEIGEIISGNLKCKFDWDQIPNVFKIDSPDNKNIFEEVLKYIINAEITGYTPINGIYPAKEFKKEEQPCILKTAEIKITFGQWSEGFRNRPRLKHFAGRQHSLSIAQSLQKKIKKLWNEKIANNPFDPVIDIDKKSWRLDAKTNWNKLDMGYSLYDEGHTIATSPITEFLAAIGLENTRPMKEKELTFKYRIWNEYIPPTLSRAIMSCSLPNIGIPYRTFSFEQIEQKNYKQTSYAKEVI